MKKKIIPVAIAISILLFSTFAIAEREEKTKSEVSGEVELSEDGEIILDELLESIELLEGKFELKLKVKKQGDELTVKRNTIEGDLPLYLMDLWGELVLLVIDLVEVAEGDDLELEIEIEHELEIEDTELR
jgi:hypothetical protein